MPGHSGATASGRRWFFNEAEWGALLEVLKAGYPYATLIYQLELRPHMDFRTGVVGERRRISEKGLLELVERRPTARSDWEEKDRDRHWVQRQISALKRYGLLEKIPRRRMVFKLLLADCGSVCLAQTRAKSGGYTRTTSAPKNTGKTQANPRLIDKATPPKGGIRAQKNTPKNTQTHTTSVKEITTTTESGFLGDQNEGGFSFAQLAAVDLDMIYGAYRAVLPGHPEAPLYNNEEYRRLAAEIWYHPAPEGVSDAYHQSEVFWRWYFHECREKYFLTGRSFKPELGEFIAHFKFLISVRVFRKVVNREYS